MQVDEYQSCSGEQIAILYFHVETANDEAESDDDGSAVPGIVRGRAEVR
jgi:hypothetical protein